VFCLGPDAAARSNRHTHTTPDPTTCTRHVERSKRSFLSHANVQHLP
jgi:hypothetical protein